MSSSCSHLAWWQLPPHSGHLSSDAASFLLLSCLRWSLSCRDPQSCKRSSSKKRCSGLLERKDYNFGGWVILGERRPLGCSRRKSGSRPGAQRSWRVEGERAEGGDSSFPPRMFKLSPRRKKPARIQWRYSVHKSETVTLGGTSLSCVPWDPEVS